MEQREVVFLNVPLLKLIGERAMRRVISCHHQHARGSTIEPVYDSRADRPAALRELPKTV